MLDTSWLSTSMPTGFATALDQSSSPMAGGDFLPMLAPLFFAFMAVYLVILLALYIYTSITLMNIANRTGTEPAWLAWVPIGNFVLTSKIAKMHWWPIIMLLLWSIGMIISTVLSAMPNLAVLGVIISFLSYIPYFVFMVFYFIWWWKICEARGRPGWWAILGLIPIFGSIWSLVMMGILAWGKD